MMHKVIADLPKLKTIELELDDKVAPKTVRSFLDCLPLIVGINVWGEELYTDKTPIEVNPENSKSLVELMEVAYWPQGKALSVFWTDSYGKKGRNKTLLASKCHRQNERNGQDVLKKCEEWIEGDF